MTARDNVQRHRTFLPCAAALLALGTLGACTSSGAAGSPGASSPASTSAGSTSKAPSSTATTSAAPSPTTSIDPVIAKIPAAARPHSQGGAEAFARFYMEQVNRAFTKADPSSLDGFSASSCKTCSSFRQGAEDLRAKGRHHEGLSISVDGAPANSYTPQTAIIQLFVTQHSVPVVDRSGTKVEQTKAGQGIFVATLTFDRHWTVERIQVAK